MTKNEAEAIERAVMAAMNVFSEAVAKTIQGERVAIPDSRVKDAIRRELRKVIDPK